MPSNVTFPSVQEQWKLDSPKKVSKNIEDVARWRMVMDDLGKMKSIGA